MSITMFMFNTFVPTATQVLRALSSVLDKDEAHALEHEIDPSVMLNARLFPDMYPLAAQVQIACDFAKGAAARLSGADNPVFPEDEKSFAELRSHIAKVLVFLSSIDAEKIEGAETRDITLKIGGTPTTFRGQPYVLGFVFPNMIFHAATAYAILRHNGVVLSKSDFIGHVFSLEVG
jgi:uncharacterized protein